MLSKPRHHYYYYWREKQRLRRRLHKKKLSERSIRIGYSFVDMDKKKETKIVAHNKIARFTIKAMRKKLWNKVA